MTFRAGQKVLASDLNERVPLFGRVTTGQTVTSSTTLVVCAGLQVAVEADSIYLLDGFIAYNTPAAADLKLALSAPSGATGHWGAFALASTSAGGIGSMELIRKTSFGTGTTTVAGGSDGGIELMCAPRAYIATSTNTGSVEFYFAQNSSNATATNIIAGSWVRLHKVV